MIVSGFSQPVTVAPGKTSLLHIYLAEWFKIEKPGSYIVHCTRTLGVTFVKSTGTVHEKQQNIVTSANLKLKILRNAKDLRQNNRFDSGCLPHLRGPSKLKHLFLNKS
ncbi:hypothetical protein CCAX7_59910 [Capsulimonas corticalis]|uniref:Uncharacterized protein n=1 Tax=Capsulimonas corticalis TaxID=2219043 RepID=A0A402CZI5_9BACT|nr:hypothetical protein [Capsulimonas corticalis]BDI33940.1 hypothetical protein CCAX7_59910 [Capsulimonas corticalis]